jgi:hypothetical protein
MRRATHEQPVQAMRAALDEAIALALEGCTEVVQR